MSWLLEVVLWVVMVATAALLVWGFIRTRNLGFLILLLAVPGWRVLERLTQPAITKQIEGFKGGEVPPFPFSFLGPTTLGEFMATYLMAMQVGQGVLFLLGILFLMLPHRVVGEHQKSSPPTDPDAHAPA